LSKKTQANRMLVRIANANTVSARKIRLLKLL